MLRFLYNNIILNITNYGDEMKELLSCKICPIHCGTDRTQQKGPCGASNKLIAAKAFLHQWEEPCISGKAGSGTIFFSGCNLHCVFCQNHDISQECNGKEISIERLAEIMLELQAQGAENVNFVTPTPYALHIIEAAALARRNGFSLPIIYNTNGYESVETIEMLKGTVDVYLPDIKYFNDRYAVKYSKAPNYFDHASKAIKAMIDQVGYPIFDDSGLMKKGVLIRHMIMPEQLEDTKNILRWIKTTLGEQTYVSLMCQYTPMYKANSYEEINRKLDDWEYEYIVDFFFKLGLENGFVQDYSSATTDYVPNFDLRGI
jgi:putative pyruvate formate lyase activating enzyme